VADGSKRVRQKGQPKHLLLVAISKND